MDHRYLSSNGGFNQLTDPGRIVSDSVKLDKDLIMVSINYRLNIFAFGDGSGERNLALRDQEIAITWVKKHIAGFGGDSVSGVYSQCQS
jgi:carboxylesterase type B